MPPKAKTTADDTTPADPAPEADPAVGDLCHEEGCFPGGWGDADQAMCAHGTWTR